MSQVDRPKEVIEATVSSYVESYVRTYGQPPSKEHINKIINDLELLAQDKERQDIVQRYSNWSVKNIREAMICFQNPTGNKTTDSKKA